MAVALAFGSPGCEKVRGIANGSFRRPAPAKEPEPGPLVVELGEGNLNSFNLQPGKVTILEYYAPWNGRSKQLETLLRGIAQEYRGRVLVGRINVEKHRRFSEAQGVQRTPYVIIFREGSQVDLFAGLPDDEEVREKIAKQVRALPKPGMETEVSGDRKSVVEPMKKNWMPEGMRRR